MEIADRDFLIRDALRLEQQLAAVEADLGTSQTTEQRQALRERAKQLLKLIDDNEQELENVERELDRQPIAKANRNRFFTQWDEHLHKIDHAKSKKMTSAMFKQFEKQSSRSSLFLFQKYETFLGKRYVEHLKKTIDSSDLGHFSRPYQVGISAGQPTPIEFLNNLGEQLGIQISPAQEMTVELILEQIKGLLKGCNIFFIEVNLPDLDGNCEFVGWFMEEFWGRVVDRMPEFLAANKSALFIGVMTLETDLEKDYLKERSCTPAKFADGKFVVLQQEKWKEDDIRGWMQKFSRLPLSADQIEKVPKSIWRSAEGLPFATEVKLLQELERLAG